MIRRILLCMALAVMAAGTARAASAPPPPADLAKKVTFDQRIGQALPLDTPVTGDDGGTATLRQRMHGKPLLLAFGYYRCPNLCDLTLHGMASAAAKVKWQAGKDYDVMFLSIAPEETVHDAREAKQMLQGMASGAHVGTWTFATATPGAVTAVTQAAGFHYFFDARNGQYAHPAGLVVVTPEGRIAQYFYGVDYNPASLSLALVDASRGQLGSLVDQVVLFCCGYDPNTGRYSLLISRLMMILGCGFVLAMLAGWWRLRRRHA